MGRPALVILTVAISMVAAAAQAQNERPVRTFPEFFGTWVLDESASTGALLITPRIPTR